MYDYVPDARWKAMSIISSLRLNGQTESLVYKDSLIGDFFKQWLKEVLCPILKGGDISIMDNLSCHCHKVKGVRELIENAGAQLRYLPQYSPDFIAVFINIANINCHKKFFLIYLSGIFFSRFFLHILGKRYNPIEKM